MAKGGGWEMGRSEWKGVVGLSKGMRERQLKGI